MPHRHLRNPRNIAAAQYKVEATVFTEQLENINDVFARLHEGRIEGRVPLDLEAGSHFPRHISAERVE